MRDRSEVWCETSDISLSEIEKRALSAYNKAGVVTTVFISLDLYSQIQKLLAINAVYSVGPTFGASPKAILRLNTSVGELHFQKVPNFRNFLLVGTKEEYDWLIQASIDPIFWNDQERAKVDREFENIIISESK